MASTPTGSGTRSSPEILLVEDDPTFRVVLGGELAELGYEIIEVDGGREALDALRRRSPDVILLDLKMPGLGGLEVLTRIREQSLSDAAVIILTGHGSIDAAIEATRLGAFHFITKPCSLTELDALIKKARDHVLLQRRNRGLRIEVDQIAPTEILGESPAIKELLAELDKVAKSSAPVLVTGESGVGKELFARRIHHKSPQSDGPFLAVNCAAIQETLLESELFGHEKGAFTGASDRKAGLMESAAGGTLLLDEIGEMSLDTQAKLLRVIQFGVFTRVGGTRECRLTARVVASTNRVLSERIREGRFREDLYFRLNTFELVVPPLRERASDIPLLAREFLARRLAGPKSFELPERAIIRLREYSWPGNVRELENVMERVAILAENAEQAVEVVERYIGSRRDEDFDRDPVRLADVEFQHIRKILDRCDGNKSEAARRLGISVKTLYNKIKAREREE